MIPATVFNTLGYAGAHNIASVSARVGSLSTMIGVATEAVSRERTGNLNTIMLKLHQI